MYDLNYNRTNLKYYNARPAKSISAKVSFIVDAFTVHHTTFTMT